MEWERAKSELREFLWNATDLNRDAKFIEHADRLIAYGDKLAGDGWSRFRIYRCMCELIGELGDKMPCRAFDMLDGYISSLTGDCSTDCIVRFPGEPEQNEVFVNYVRGKRWVREAGVYSIADGRAHFEGLLDQIEPALARLVAVHEVTTIGLTCASINGGIAFCADRADRGHQKGAIPAEFEFSSFLTFEIPASPLQEWSDVYWNDGKLRTEDDQTVEGWANNQEFVRPIFQSICTWMDEAFVRGRFQNLKPARLVVDEVDGKIHCIWKPGTLRDPIPIA